jgi:hypothetical protein
VAILHPAERGGCCAVSSGEEWAQMMMPFIIIIITGCPTTDSGAKPKFNLKHYPGRERLTESVN